MVSLFRLEEYPLPYIPLICWILDIPDSAIVESSSGRNARPTCPAGHLINLKRSGQPQRTSKFWSNSASMKGYPHRSRNIMGSVGSRAHKRPHVSQISRGKTESTRTDANSPQNSLANNKRKLMEAVKVTGLSLSRPLTRQCEDLHKGGGCFVSLFESMAS